ncbi:MAG: hypothetical protein EA350_13855 [Gemmatimonadales bacterium]|nr:MAG: hypothetical protein EA350_13855 [Gemmatimonadales bacterium]
MTFLLPAALAALVLVGLPVAIHLLRREETREESFPALRYLLSDLRVRQRRLRLREQILLALRVTAVLAAVLAAARWVMPVGSGHLPPADVVIVLENGIVSGAVVDGRRILDDQRALAAELLDRLGDHDRVWVMPTAPADTPVFPLTRSEAVMALESVEPVAEPVVETGPPAPGPGASVERAVERARALLAVRPAALQRVVVVRSDGARIPEDGSVPAPGVLELDPGVDMPENRGITAVEVNGGLVPRAGEPVTVDVQLRASPPGGSDVAADVPVRLVVGGETVAAGRTDAEGRVRLTLAPLQEGSISGWVEIDPDALRLDDRVALAFRVVPPPTVRVLGDPGRWTRLALATLDEGGRIRMAAGPVPPGRIRSEIEPLPPLPAGSALLVTEDLVVALPPADPSLAAGLDPWIEALTPEGARGRIRLAEPSAPGTFLEVSGVQGLPTAMVGTEIHRRYRLAGGGPEGGVRVLAHLLDGTPWILEVGPGVSDPGDAAGRAPDRWTLRVLGSPLDPAWGDLPTSAAMVPALERLLLPGAGATDPGGPASAGVAPLPPSPVVSAGPPPPGWSREVLVERRGREGGPFLAWLLFVILCTEGWLAAGPRAGNRPDHETSTPP